MVDTSTAEHRTCSSAFAGWEVHTRGIGSRLLAKMGYEFGKGEWGPRRGGRGAGGRGPQRPGPGVPQPQCQSRASPGLGRHAEGRVEPVHAVVLPRGKSLDQCAETLQRAAGGRKAAAHRPPRCRGRGRRPGGRPPPRTVFDVLNEKLQGRAPGALEPGAPPAGRSSKELYHASKSTRRALSLRLLQTEGKIEQAQRDIRGLQQALARHAGR